MKNILITMLFCIALAVQSMAQNATLIPLAAGDTLTTSSSKDTVSKVIRSTAGYQSFAIQTVATKLSGTVAGKVYLYGSLDGTNYVVTDSSAAFANQTTNTAVFIKEYTPYTYYRVEARTSDGANSTQSVIYRFYYVFRRYATQ